MQQPDQDRDLFTQPDRSSDAEPEQLPLLDVGHWWDDAWGGMPEYLSDDLAPQRTLLVHFTNDASVRKFAELVGQTITQDTRFIWYPEQQWIEAKKHKWVDENDPAVPALYREQKPQSLHDDLADANGDES